MEKLAAARVSTGLDWLDRILGGGLPAQSLVVLAGVPGSGKSILAFHLLAQAALESGNAMLVTTTHQPVSKMRAQYSGLNFLGPTGVFDQLDVLELDTDIEDDTLLRLLNAQLVENNCLGLLVGEYSLPRDLDLPELAMADVVIYLEVERLVASDLRTLRIYKMRGSKYVEGRQAFFVDDDGIQFLGSSPEQLVIDPDEEAEPTIWPPN